MTLSALALRCCAPIAHIARHRLARTIIAAGVGAGAGGTAVHRYAGPSPVRVASVGCAGAAVPLGIPASAFVVPNAGERYGGFTPVNAGFSGTFTPDFDASGTLGFTPVNAFTPVEPEQSVPEPSWGVIGLAGSIAATALLIAVWPRR